MHTTDAIYGRLLASTGHTGYRIKRYTTVADAIQLAKLSKPQDGHVLRLLRDALA